MKTPFMMCFAILCWLWCMYAGKKYRVNSLKFGMGLLDFALLYGLMTIFILK